MNNFYVPDVTRNSNVLSILLVGQLIATCYWLATYRIDNFSQFGLISAYLLALNLSIIPVIGLFRSRIQQAPFTVGVGLFCLAFVLAILAAEALSQLLLANAARLFDLSRMANIALIAIIVSLLLARFFTLLNVLKLRNQAEAEARVIALQARIQPHFLFNSLNTISELTATSPEDAEEAIHSLSLLFRASLENRKNLHSLESEINLCRRYVDLERWRFEEKLQVKWYCDVQDSNVLQVPKLILQPLIENAIKYGTRGNGRAKVRIDVRETNDYLSFLIENAKSESQTEKQGHGIALDNIRERLILLYDDQHSFRIRNNEKKFGVLMRLPKARLVG